MIPTASRLAVDGFNLTLFQRDILCLDENVSNKGSTRVALANAAMTHVSEHRIFSQFVTGRLAGTGASSIAHVFFPSFYIQSSISPVKVPDKQNLWDSTEKGGHLLSQD